MYQLKELWIYWAMQKFAHLPETEKHQKKSAAVAQQVADCACALPKHSLEN